MGFGSAFFLITFVIRSLWADSTPLPHPAKLCEEEWKTFSPQDYLLDLSSQETYPDYQNRMNARGLDRKTCHKMWSYLSYISVREDLFPFSLHDIYEMEAAKPQSNHLPGSTLRSDVLVQIDSQTENISRRFHIFKNNKDPFSETTTQNEIAFTSLQKIRSPIVWNRSNMSSVPQKQRLEDFLAWAMTDYSAEHHVLSISGHGLMGKLAIEGASALGLQDIHDVLKNIHKRRSRPLDLLIVDACLWFTLTDVEKIARHTLYVTGSEDLESAAGIPNGSVICRMNSRKYDPFCKDLRPEEKVLGELPQFAATIAQVIKKSFDPIRGNQRNNDPNARYKFTSSTINSRHLLTTFIPSLNRLGLALVQYINEDASDGGRWINLKELIQSGNYFHGDTQDIGIFLERLSQLIFQENPRSRRVMAALDELKAAINYTLVGRPAFGENYSPHYKPDAHFHPMGLSIWLPKTQEDFETHLPEFSDSSVLGTRGIQTGQDPGWLQWMKTMYPSPTQAPTQAPIQP